MNIQNSKALQPVQTAVSIYQDHYQKGLDRFKRQYQPQDRIRFLGYLPDTNDNIYYPYGKNRVKNKILGELIDIYV